MKEIKKYTDIVRYGKANTMNVFQEGDTISITEKIDGSNASFRSDETNPLGVSCYSRRQPVTDTNTFEGLYNWFTQTIVPVKNKLNQNYIYYGEWLNKRKVIYKPEYYKNFYMFSIWDIEKEQYLSDEVVISEAERLGLKTINYFYIGKYISFEHLMSFVGKSNMTLTPNTGEGVVVKNADYFDNRSKKQIFVKLVSERFAEIQKQRLPKNPCESSPIIELVRTVLTKPRVEKIMYNLVDEGLLKSDYDIEDMGIILKALGSRVYEDIMKEESDLFIEYEEDKIKRTIGKNVPNVVKQVLKEQGKM